MAHTLAEAICELAAPPHQPCFIRAYVNYSPSYLMLLHVRPRALSAGLEVAVHTGIAEGDEGTAGRVGSEGALYALPSSAAGLAAFVEDLLATSLEEMDDYGDRSLVLPSKYGRYTPGWDSVHLELLKPGQVQAVAQQCGTYSWVQLTLPTCFESNAAAAASVRNGAEEYGRCQEVIKRVLHAAEQKRKAEAEAAASGAAPPEAAAAAAPARKPDSNEVFEQKWLSMRDKAMEELTAALGAMLRQAERYRGPARMPLTEAPVAEAAGAQPAGGA